MSKDKGSISLTDEEIVTVKIKGKDYNRAAKSSAGTEKLADFFAADYGANRDPAIGGDAGNLADFMGGNPPPGGSDSDGDPRDSATGDGDVN